MGPRLRERTVTQPVGSMVLMPVETEEVARVLRGLSTKMSCDINGVSVWLLKQCCRHLLAPLVRLINTSFETGNFPNLLKIAKIIPVFKNKDPGKIDNYRPISILPVISKVFEKIFLVRFEHFLSRFEILHSEQYGFRKNKSAVDAVTNLVEFIVDGMEKKERVLSIFLDLSKAFDCVHHETLLNQLQRYGIRGLPHQWLSSYLQGRVQCVQVEDVLSGTSPITQGVPQGSILGPVLFNIYVNEIKSSIQYGRVIQYADDTTLSLKGTSTGELEIKSFIDVNQCIQQFAELNLLTNSSKSNVINFRLQQRDDDNLVSITMNDVVLQETESTKFLGIHLDRGLTWDYQVDAICSKVSSGIYALRYLAKFCSLEVLKMAYFGLIHTHLAYGIRLWGSCSKYKFQRIFRLQKRAVRVLLKLKFRDSCRGAFRELGLLTLPSIYILEVALYCKAKLALVQGRDIHCYETRGRDSYRVRQHRTAASERLPTQIGVKIMNNLPQYIKSQSVDRFKSRLKRFLLSKSFYSVEEFIEGC